MSQATLPGKVSRVGPLQISVIVLALVTGLIHLYRGLMMMMMAGPRPGGPGHLGGPPPGGGPSIMALLPLPLTDLFILNFIGYTVLAIGLYLPPLQQYRQAIRWVLIVYAAITIILWFLITMARPNVLAYIDKPIELALIILLLIDSRQAARQAQG
ncbi:MAG: hypothetical protein JOZ18_03890 [Chloroflexi bacterium]|nr:hypothetical protein [Chloroflexota bacterium]